MARKWTLTDVERGRWQERFAVRGAGPRGAAPWSVSKRTLHGGLAEGVEVVEVDNGALAFSVLPTRGMGVWRGRYRGLPLGWRSPVRGPVHPGFVNLADRGGLGWLQGFDELIVRCGLESNGAPCTDLVPNNNGVPVETALPLHGRIANLPACQVQVEVGAGRAPELAVSGRVEESALFTPGLCLATRISTRAGSNALTVADEVTNLRAVPAEMELLYHCNLGGPFLEAGARIVAPAREVAPRDRRAAEGMAGYATCLGPTAGYTEQVYYYDLHADRSGRTLAMLRNAAGDRGVALRFSRKELPCLAHWKNTAAESDGYVTGIEPATNFPNAKPFERKQGRVVRLAPGASYRATVTMEVLDSAAAVRAVEREAAKLSGGRAPEVHKRPRPGWSP